MDEQKNILILRYLNGELSQEEQTAFEASLLNDEELQAGVLEYKQIMQVVKVKERQNLKATIAAIGSGIAPKDLESYEPKYPPPSNVSSWGEILKSILFFLFVILAACLVLIYFNQFPVEHPAVEKIREKIIQLDENTTVNPDTVFQTIENELIETDTIIYGKDELIEYYEKIEVQITEEVIVEEIVVVDSVQGNEYE